jgi:hypothetical protein
MATDSYVIIDDSFMQFHIGTISKNEKMHEQYQIDFPRSAVFFNNVKIHSIEEFESCIKHFPIMIRQEYRSLCSQGILAEYITFLQSKLSEKYIGEQVPGFPVTVYFTNTSAIVIKPMRVCNTEETFETFTVKLYYVKGNKTVMCCKFTS